MQKIIKVVLVSVVAGLFGCEKQLTNEPIGLTTLESVNTTPTLATVENSVNSSYQLLSNTLNILGQWDWGGGLVFQNDLIMQDIASDDMEKKWNPDGDQPWMDDINNFTFTSTNGGPNGLWKYDYEGIKRLNIAIGLLTNPDIEQITGITTARKSQLLGEAYFLRSYYYFSLVTNFGGVPLILQPVENYKEAFDVAVRVDKDAVYKQINDDLELSIGFLPNSKYSSDTEKWRASKGAAIALRAKTALYNQKWDDVISYVNDLQTLNFYDLNDHYFDSFDQSKEFADDEVIFAYDHQSNTNPRRGNGICAPLGWGFFAPSTDFLNAFEPNDPRKLYTVDAPNQNVHKLLGALGGVNKGNDDAANNKIYIRYADVLLWKAEALNEKDQFNDAVDLINEVRQRARNTPPVGGGVVLPGTLPDRPYTTNKNQIKEWLIHERRVELGFESQRFLDLKRWGLAKSVLNAMGKNYKDFHALYPLPQSEVDASADLLKQNDPY